MSAKTAVCVLKALPMVPVSHGGSNRRKSCRCCGGGSTIIPHVAGHAIVEVAVMVIAALGVEPLCQPPILIHPSPIQEWTLRICHWLTLPVAFLVASKDMSSPMIAFAITMWTLMLANISASLTAVVSHNVQVSSSSSNSNLIPL